MVNYIKHTRGTWEHFRKDRRLTSTHKILYLALFECWNRNRFRNPVSINRDEIMWDASINSSKLYYKAMKDLQNWGYIQYRPSNNMYIGSKVLLCRYDLTEPLAEGSIDTPTEDLQGARSINSINNKNIKNSLNGGNVLNASNKNGAPAQAQKDDSFENIDSNTTETSEKPPSDKKETTEGAAGAAADVPESMEQVVEFFLEELDDEEYESEADKYEFEAEKFFNYYESIGWVLSGQIPIKNWRACARTWILRTAKFDDIVPVRMPVNRQAHQRKEKNYAEPL